MLSILLCSYYFVQVVAFLQQVFCWLPVLTVLVHIPFLCWILTCAAIFSIYSLKVSVGSLGVVVDPFPTMTPVLSANRLLVDLWQRTGKKCLLKSRQDSAYSAPFLIPRSQDDTNIPLGQKVRSRVPSISIGHFLTLCPMLSSSLLLWVCHRTWGFLASSCLAQKR